MLCILNLEVIISIESHKKFVKKSCIFLPVHVCLFGLIMLFLQKLKCLCNLVSAVLKQTFEETAYSIEVCDIFCIL